MALSKKKKIGLAAGGAVLLVALSGWIAWGNTALELNTYTIESDRLPTAFDGYRIAHISDLHNTEIGADNETLLALLQQAQPDIIVGTGDLIDSRRTDTETALQFVEQALTIAPCYLVEGNHEIRIPERNTFKAQLTALGAVVLDNESIPLERDGEHITLLGVPDPTALTADIDAEAGLLEKQLQALTENTDGYTILLSHRPEMFEVYVANNIDLVFSGHTHGGQIRLPFIGGLFGPRQGLLPTYTEGLHTSATTSMLISRGIGNSLFPFRVNNRPEVIVAELQLK